MKKFLVTILAVVIIAVAGTVIFLQIRTEKMPVTDILPAGPVSYIRVTDLEKNINGFTATRFWEGVAGIDYGRVLEQLRANEEAQALYENFKRNFPSPATQAFLKKFFGQEVAVAVYPTSLEDFSPENLLKITSNVVFVIRPKPEARFAESLISVFTTLYKDISTRTTEYKKHKIHVIATSDGKLNIGYVRIKDLFVFGLGEKSARECLDVFDKEKKSLSQENYHSKMKAGFLPKAHLAGYINFTLLVSSVKDQVLRWATQYQEDVKGVEEQFQQNLKQIEGFKALSFSGVFQEAARFKMNVHFDPNALGPDGRSLHGCRPQENETFAFVPAEVLGYQWSNCYDFVTSWNQVQKQVTEGESAHGRPIPIREMLGSFEENVGLSLENDILPAFGDEFGGFLTDIDVKGLFPVPQLAFFVKLTDGQKAREILNTLIEGQSFLRPESEHYDAVEIEYFTIPLIGNLAPAYTFLEDYLLIATDRQLLKDAISGRNSPEERSLTANLGFQEIDFGLSKKSNSVFFLQLGKLMNKAQFSVDWLNQWITTQSSKQDAFKKGSERRLKDVREGITRQEEEINVLHAKAVAVRKSLQEKPGADVSSIDELVRQIKEKEQDIQTTRETAEDLEKLIKDYEFEVETVKMQGTLVDELFKPLLKVFAFVEVFASRVVFGEGTLETFLYWKLE